MIDYEPIFIRRRNPNGNYHCITSERLEIPRILEDIAKQIKAIFAAELEVERTLLGSWTLYCTDKGGLKSVGKNLVRIPICIEHCAET